MFVNKGSLFRTRKSFERDHCVQLSAHVACLMFDLCILCLVQEHWALLYFRNAMAALHWIKVYEFFCLYAFVLPNICKSMNHAAGHCYCCTNIVSQNWNKLYLQLLHIFCTSISSLKRILLLLSIDSVPVKATKVINVSLKACLYLSISVNWDPGNVLATVPTSVNCGCSHLWKQLGLRFQQLDFNHHSNFSCTSTS